MCVLSGTITLGISPEVNLEQLLAVILHLKAMSATQTIVCVLENTILYNCDLVDRICRRFPG